MPRAVSSAAIFLSDLRAALIPQVLALAERRRDHIDQQPADGRLDTERLRRPILIKAELEQRLKS